jgi:hypothetical protein
MRVTGHSDNPLAYVAPDQLEAFLANCQAFPELLYEIHIACCNRRFAGWDVMAARALDLFMAARQQELEGELQKMKGRFAAAVARAAQPVAVADATSAPLKHSPSPSATTAKAPRPPPAKPRPQPPRSWPETALQVRHAAMHADAAKLRTAYTAAEWAEYSPMKLLGYSVGAQGLPDADRREFLADFIEKADLPTQLPEGYVAPWGKPATAARLQRTARHLGFLWHQRERQDLERYAVAIACWRRDYQFLEEHYGSMLSSREWREAAAGR